MGLFCLRSFPDRCVVSGTSGLGESFPTVLGSRVSGLYGDSPGVPKQDRNRGVLEQALVGSEGVFGSPRS